MGRGKGTSKPSCYKVIPKELPSNVTLTEVVKTLPKEVFVKDMRKAWTNVAITIIACVLSQYLLYLAPWYLLPVAWIFAGTATTGLFVIGHDCGHLSFARSHLLNDVVGTLSFLPLIYPFEAWRIQHNHHHAHTNKLDIDNAWQPFRYGWYARTTGFKRVISKYIKGPLWFLASIGHWQAKHFLLDQFKPTQQPKVLFGIGCILAYGAAFFPAVVYYMGVWGLIKHWLVPWLGFHFWMSTFTMVHHTLPHIPFVTETDWTDARARLGSTVHCAYPKWIERLCHQINVHIPHHVCTGIPSYNLWQAHYALKAKWGSYMHECTFGFELIKDITTKCHIYDNQTCYRSFDEADNFYGRKNESD